MSVIVKIWPYLVSAAAVVALLLILVRTFLRRTIDWLRLQRFTTALASPGLGVLAIIVAALTLFVDAVQAHPAVTGFFWALLVIVGLVWVIQTMFEYRRATHEPTWAMHYIELWDGDKAEKWRQTAARTLLEDLDREAPTQENFDRIDEVLDILEDVAFYVVGGQISPEVAHHQFYWWIRGYWSASEGYVKKIIASDEPRWEHLEKLHEITSEVERKINGEKAKTMLDRKDLESFLFGERDLNI